MSGKQKKYKCFIITPFGKSEKEKEMFNKVYKATLDAANRILDFSVVVERADINLKEFELIKSVHKHIDESHFCIIDLTGLNPNVLYEMGYAAAKGRELIAISQDKAPYPIDVANLIVTQYSVEDDSNLEGFSQKLASIVEKAIELIQVKARSIKDTYEVKCFQNRRIADLNNSFRSAKNKIDILQTNLDTVEKEYLESLIFALENNEQLRLRILTLDPDSYFAQKRAEQLGLAVSHYRDELHTSIRSIISKLSVFGERFSLRIYEDFPTQITYVIDDFVYTCIVARSVRSRELCTFMLEKFAAGVERSFLFHFDSIWANAREYQFHTLR